MSPAYLGQRQRSLGHRALCQRDCSKASPVRLLPAAQHGPGTIGPFYRSERGSSEGRKPRGGGRHCWVGVETGSPKAPHQGWPRRRQLGPSPQLLKLRVLQETEKAPPPAPRVTAHTPRQANKEPPRFSQPLRSCRCPQYKTGLGVTGNRGPQLATRALGSSATCDPGQSTPRFEGDPSPVDDLWKGLGRGRPQGGMGREGKR